MKKLLLSGIAAATLASCSMTSPVTATNNPIGSKEGKSETTCIFYGGGLSSGIVLNKSYGIAEAAKKGKITKIATVDLKVQNFLIFSKNTLIVTGE